MLILPIAPPGSGKSTLVTRLRQQLADMVVVAPDTIRRDFYGVQFDRRVEPLVWAHVRLAVEGHLRLGRRWIALDATNLTRRQRRPFIRLARRYGRPVVGARLSIPLTEVLRRNAGRRGEPMRYVPEAIVRRKAASLEPPSPAEGITYLWQGEDADDLLAFLRALPRSAVDPSPPKAHNGRELPPSPPNGILGDGCQVVGHRTKGGAYGQRAYLRHD